LIYNASNNFSGISSLPPAYEQELCSTRYNDKHDYIISAIHTKYNLHTTVAHTSRTCTMNMKLYCISESICHFYFHHNFNDCRDTLFINL